MTTETTQQQWDGQGREARESSVACCGWVNRKGYLTPMGQRVACSCWTALSPAAQRIISADLNNRR